MDVPLTYIFQIIIIQEFLNGVWAKQPSRSSWTGLVAPDFVGVWPHKIAHCPLVGHLHFPVNPSEFVQFHDFGGDSAVHAPDFVVDNDWECQIVENVCAVPPDIQSPVLDVISE